MHLLSERGIQYVQLTWRHREGGKEERGLITGRSHSEFGLTALVPTIYRVAELLPPYELALLRCLHCFRGVQHKQIRRVFTQHARTRYTADPRYDPHLFVGQQMVVVGAFFKRTHTHTHNTFERK